MILQGRKGIVGMFFIKNNIWGPMILQDCKGDIVVYVIYKNEHNTNVCSHCAQKTLSSR